MARSVKVEKHSRRKELFFDSDSLRWSTPEVVADYRAGRLKCGVIADLCCGIGFQAFAFARVCRKVYAVEIDGAKLGCAVKNAEVLGIKNIEFIQGDVLGGKIAGRLKCDAFFCDPERPSGESERRVASIAPDINALVKAYRDIAVEFPPQIRDIPFECEKEYISVGGVLNRLTLYFGRLKKHGVNVVSLPSGRRLCAKGCGLRERAVPARYLYEVDTAVVKAGLAGELAEETGSFGVLLENKVFLSSEVRAESVFFRNSFEVLCSCDEGGLLKALRRFNAGSVVLRFSVEPKEYWGLRKKYERLLSGREELFVFRGGVFIVARKF